MKKMLLPIFFFFFTFSVSAQSEQETQNISTFIKVWGFLKYYHPEVAKGKFNWDEEFMSRVDVVRKLNGKEEINKFYLNWLESLGEVKKCRKCDNNIPDSLKFNLDNGWLKDTNQFSNTLSQKLRYIELNRNQGKNKYVKKTRWIGSAEMINEEIYKDSVFPSMELRLLGLARFWNFTNYYFPYKYQMDVPWKKTLDEMTPKFLYSNDTISYHRAMLELVVRIDDTHGAFGTYYSFYPNGFRKPPFISYFIDEKLIVSLIFNDSICQKMDIKVGDEILSIDGESPIDRLNKNLKFIYGSNANVKKSIYSRIILNGHSDSILVEFKRNEETYTKLVPRYPINSKFFDLKKLMREDTLSSYHEISPEIAYLNLGKLEYKELKETMKKAMSKKAIIFDLRNYPNVYATAFAPYLNKERVPFVRFTNPDLSYPGIFKYTEMMYCGKKKNDNYYKGKIVILVNSNTQSAAEFTVMALQSTTNATCIGSQTSGADGNVTSIIFPGDIKTRFSGIGVYYPDGRETQRVGVKVDIEVKSTLQGLREGRDEVLEKAIEVINQE